jgi:bacteriocin biosynthesis cyclodehydratase domain-containing protein
MAARPPLHPMLRPGLLVARRDESWLQVGLEPGRRVALPDRPSVREALAALGPGPTPDLSSPVAVDTVASLAEHGLLVDRQEVSTALARTRDPVQRAAITAAFASHGDDAAGRLRARASATITVRTVGHAPLLASWRDTAAGLLKSAGIATVHERDDPLADVALVVSGGEPDRDLLDGPITTGQPHLLVVVVEGEVHVGPFVVPGETACLRCVDAHLDEGDGRRAVVLRQHGTAAPGILALPAPGDPALVTMALGWAVRDVVTFVDGGRPATWSATVRLDPDLALTRRMWHRHPHCGCCWDALLDDAV